MPASKQHFLFRLTSPAFLVAMFLCSALLVLVITPLFQKGSFIDAMLYKTVAFNFSIAEGSFWNMKYTNTSMTFFCEQPPLYIYLLGNFYKIFGSHYLVDRVFTFIQLGVFLFFLFRICQKLFVKALPFFLLNLLLLLSIQSVFWSFANQVIETLVLMWMAMVIDFFLCYLKFKKPVYGLSFILVLIAMFLTKGFQSCFIIVLPISYALFNLKAEKILWFVFYISISLLIFILTLLFFYIPAKEWYTCYYNARLVLTMNNIGATTNNHFTILFQLLMETLVIWLIFGSLVFYLRLKKQIWNKIKLKSIFVNRLGMSFLFTFLAGSLPFTLSLVQRSFYLVPAYLCLILFLTYTFRFNWLFFIQGCTIILKKKAIKPLIHLIFVASVLYFGTQVNQYKRERELAHDLALITPFLKSESTVSISPNVWNYFNLHSYLYMQKKISLNGDAGLKGFIIVYKNDIPGINKKFLYKVQLPTMELDLYYRAKL